MSTGRGNALRLFLFCTGSRLAADEDDSSGNAVTGFDSIVDGDCATDGEEVPGGSGDDVVDDDTIESVVVVAVNAAADGVSPLSLLILLLPALLVTASMSAPAPAIRAYTSSY